MFIRDNKYPSIIRAIVLALICLFLLNDTVYAFSDTSIQSNRSALAPPSAIKPLCKVVQNQDGTFKIVTEQVEDLGNDFRNSFAFVDVGYVIGQMLTFNKEHELKSSKEILINLIRMHLRKIGGGSEILLERYDVDGIKEIKEGDVVEGFILPVTINGKPAYELVYNLQDGDAKIPMQDGTTFYVSLINAEENAVDAATVRVVAPKPRPSESRTRRPRSGSKNKAIPKGEKGEQFGLGFDSEKKPVELTAKDFLEEDDIKEALSDLGCSVEESDGKYYISNKLIPAKTLEFRAFQITMADLASKGNTLTILPTGLGKTAIAALAMCKILSQNPDARILIIAPTKALVVQLHKYMKRLLHQQKIAMIRAEDKEDKRQAKWQENRIIITTSHLVNKDIEKGSPVFKLSEVDYLIVDEAHHIIEEHPSSVVVKKYSEVKPDGLRLGLTASPGDKIDTISAALGCSYDHIDIRTYNSRDVKPYYFWSEPQIVEVAGQDPLVELIIRDIENMITDYLAYTFSYVSVKSGTRKSAAQPALPELRAGLKNLPTDKDYIKRNVRLLSRHDLLTAISAILQDWKPKIPNYNNEDYIWSAIKACTKASILSHALHLLDTHGLYEFVDYLEDQRENIKKKKEGTKSAQELMREPDIRRAESTARDLIKQGVEHPKVAKLLDIVDANKGKKMLIFASYRSSVRKITNEINLKYGGEKACYVTGIGEMREKEREQILDRFRKGEFDILVATSALEEGIDLPELDTVIMYEPVSDERRMIQRTGRQGRTKPGEVYILVTKGTRDEGELKAYRKRLDKMEGWITQFSNIATLSRLGRKAPKAPNGSIYKVFELLSDLEATNISTGLTGEDIAKRLDREYATIEPDLVGLYNHLKLVEREEVTEGTKKDARYFVPESVKKKDPEIRKLLYRLWEEEGYRPKVSVLKKFYEEEILPLISESVQNVVAASPESERSHSINLQDVLTYMQAAPQSKPVIVALGTSWIKGYEKGQFQHDALNPLMSNMKNRQQFIVAEDKDLLADIKKKMSEKGFENARVIVLAGEETVTTKELVDQLDNGSNILLGVDNRNLTVDSYVRLMEMLEIASKLALDPNLSPSSPNIPMEKRGKYWIFIPKAEPMHYEDLKTVYEIQKFA